MELKDAEALNSSTINGQEFFFFFFFSTFLNEKIATIGENLVARKIKNVLRTSC